jgi:hypothetical protein
VAGPGWGPGGWVDGYTLCMPHEGGKIDGDRNGRPASDPPPHGIQHALCQAPTPSHTTVQIARGSIFTPALPGNNADSAK